MQSKICLFALLSSALAAQQPVRTVAVVSRATERAVSLPGEFTPYLSVAIHAKVTGFVSRVEVDRGSQVKKDQLLAMLEAPELKSQVLEADARVRAVEAQRAEAEAKLVSAQSTYERLKAASQTPGAIAQNELIVAEKSVDAAKAQVLAVESSIKAAQASMAALRDMENYLRVTAPFAGVITERNIHPGALVGPEGGRSEPMFRLEQNSRLRLVVAVPEVDVSGIATGAYVPFRVPAFPVQNFTGKIARVAHSLDPKTRSMAVELDVANPRGLLAPGMYPTVTWPVRRSRPSLQVPASSIVTTTESTFVIRVRNGQAEWVPVSRGAAAGALVEVYGALAAGDRVIERGSDEIRPGTPVTEQK